MEQAGEDPPTTRGKIAAHKARNAAEKVKHAALQEAAKATALKDVMPSRERAIVGNELLSAYLMNMNH
jgi:hypothetical protein